MEPMAFSAGEHFEDPRAATGSLNTGEAKDGSSGAGVRGGGGRRVDVAATMSDEKKEFSRRRCLQSMCGGVRLRVPGAAVPAYAAALQLSGLLIGPAVAAALCLALPPAGGAGGMTDLAAQLGASVAVAAALPLVFAAVGGAVRRTGGLGDAGGISGGGGGGGAAKWAAADDEIDFDGAGGVETWGVVSPESTAAAVAARVALSAVLYAVASLRLHGAVGGVGAGAAAWGWVVVALAGYGLITGVHAPNIAKWHVASSRGVAAAGPAAVRPVHAILLLLPGAIVAVASVDAAPGSALALGGAVDAAASVCDVLFLCLPLLWAVAILPSPRVLFEAALERAGECLLGASPAHSLPRLAVVLVVHAAAVAVGAGVGAASSAAMGAATATATLWLLLRLAPRLLGLCWPASSDIDADSGAGPFVPDAVVPAPATGSADEAQRQGGRGPKGSARATPASLVVDVLALVAIVCGGVAADAASPSGVAVVASGAQQPSADAVVLLAPLFGLFVVVAGVSIAQQRLMSPTAGSPAVGAVYRFCRALLQLCGLAFAVLAVAADSTAVAGAAGVSWVGMGLGATRMAARVLATPMAAAADVAVVLLGDAVVGAGWNEWSLWARLVVSGVVVDCVHDTTLKASFVTTHLLTASSQPKLRFPHAGAVLALSALLSPALLVVAAAASLLKAPLVPVLGLPLFAIGHPRPRRQFFALRPLQVAPDGALYQQLTPHLLEALRDAAARGALGELGAGDVLLVRLDDLLALVCVLEVSAGGGVVVEVRGMEHQEATSCHHVEAGVVDEVFAAVTPAKDGGGGGGMARAAQGGGALRPLARVPLRAYTATSMSMVGVLDSPDALKCMAVAFPRALVLLLTQRALRGGGGKLPASWGSPCRDLDGRDLHIAKSRFPAAFAAFVKGKVAAAPGSAVVDVAPAAQPAKPAPAASPVRSAAAEEVVRAAPAPASPEARPQNDAAAPAARSGERARAVGLRDFGDDISDDDYGGGATGAANAAGGSRGGAAAAAPASPPRRRTPPVQQPDPALDDVAMTDFDDDADLLAMAAEVEGGFAHQPAAVAPAASTSVGFHQTHASPAGARRAGPMAATMAEDVLDDDGEDLDMLLAEVMTEGPQAKFSSPARTTYSQGAAQGAGGGGGGYGEGGYSSAEEGTGGGGYGGGGGGNRLGGLLDSDSDDDGDFGPGARPMAGAAHGGGGITYLGGGRTSGGAGGASGAARGGFGASTEERARPYPVGPSVPSSGAPDRDPAFAPSQPARGSGGGRSRGNGGNARAAPAAGAALRGGVDESGEMEPLSAVLANAVAQCDALLQIAGLGCAGGDAVAAGASHVARLFAGEVPPSTGARWLEERPALCALAMEAYRLAVKLGMDAMVMAECDTLCDDDDDQMTDLFDQMIELQATYHMGPVGDSSWNAAIASEVSHLFSVVKAPAKPGGGRGALSAAMGNSGADFSGRLLTLEEHKAWVGKLNREVAHGFWASLTMELLYFTNDDDERYSIQAHKQLLRNLLVQGARPPLGYPVFSTGRVRMWLPAA